VPLDTLVLLFFGIVREYKGLQDILRALPGIQEQLGKVLLLVAGEFWENKQRHLETVKQLGIGNMVIFEDRYIPNEEVAAYFSAADLLVAPYRQATGSGAVQMALGFECPIVTTDVGSLAELASHREDVFAVPPSDPSSLADAIVRYFVNLHTMSAPLPTPGEQKTSSWSSLVNAIESSAMRAGPDHSPL
jgi:D-inositol-3-phosphate glycosyltransferase